MREFRDLGFAGRLPIVIRQDTVFGMIRRVAMAHLNLGRVLVLVSFVAFVSYMPPANAQNSKSLLRMISDLKKTNKLLEQRLRKLESALVVTANQVKIRNLLVEGNTNVGGNLSVGSNVAIARNLSASGNLSVGSNATIGRSLSASGDLSVGSNAAIGRNLSANGDLSVGANAAIGRNLSANGNIAGQKNLMIGDNLTAKNIRLNGDIKIANKVTLSRRSLAASGNYTIKSSGNLIFKGSKITGK